jgi:hypothetical protein
MFLKLWQGQLSLPKTYWIFGVLVNIFLGIPITIYLELSGEVQQSYFSLYIGYFLIYLVYNVVVAIGLWRSATHYDKSKLWKYLSKAVAVISLLFIVLAIVLQVKSLSSGLNFGSQHTYDRYECTNKTAKVEDDCGLVYAGTIKFTVDKPNNQVLALRIDNNGVQNISKLSNCLIIDNSNWSCIPKADETNYPSGLYTVIQSMGVKTIDGVTTATNGLFIQVKNGAQSASILRADVLKKR